MASGIAAGALAPAADAGTQRSAATTTRITVNAAEFKFALSKSSVPIGTTVIFTVVNKGKIAHDFKIAGKKTPTLAPGKSATVTTTFKTKGQFAYVCTLPGHAGAGMKGTFAVGIAPAAAVITKVTVSASEFKFALSRRAVPVGSTVMFTVINKGKIAHDFRIFGKKTPTLAPGKSATLTVGFKTGGQYAYVCTLPGHAAAGMKGTFAIGVAPVTTAPVATTTSPAPTPPPAPVSTVPETLKGDPVAGKAVFLANGCAACHTLAAAQATGTVGPNLDARKPSQGTISTTVQSGTNAGGATMPAFNLSATDLANLAAFVYQASHP